MEYQTVVGCCGGAGAGGDEKDDRNKKRVPEAGAGQNNSNRPLVNRCPRCDSTNIKFCYYNNYSLSQPRFFCKGCKRYWTHGGALRNVPVGGKCRRTKRPRLESEAVSATDMMASGSQQPASLPLPSMPTQSAAVPPPVVFLDDGNMRHFGHQNDVNSMLELHVPHAAISPSRPSSFCLNILGNNNDMLRGTNFMSIPLNNVQNFYPATRGPVLGGSLNVDNDALPPPPPQSEVHNNNNNNNNNHAILVEENSGEHNILEWADYMGTGEFDEGR